jgi:hypothetical protein
VTGRRGQLLLPIACEHFHVMVNGIASVRLPDPGLAPAYRSSLAERSHFAVDDFGAGLVGVAQLKEPVKSPGTVPSSAALNEKKADSKEIERRLPSGPARLVGGQPRRIAEPLAQSFVLVSLLVGLVRVEPPLGLEGS